MEDGVSPTVFNSGNVILEARVMMTNSRSIFLRLLQTA